MEASATENVVHNYHDLTFEADDEIEGLEGRAALLSRARGRAPARTAFPSAPLSWNEEPVDYTQCMYDDKDDDAAFNLMLTDDEVDYNFDDAAHEASYCL
jgi:hypothetical protein